MSDDLFAWDSDGLAAWASANRGETAVLIHTMRGFIDAGHAGQILASHLLDQADPIRVATFDVDRLLDYRSRRPEMVFDVNTWTAYDEPYLRVDMLVDDADRAYLLLHGFEPDVLWEKYIAAVRSLVEVTGVGLTLGAHGIPMAAPHTRPLGATLHGTRPDILPATPNFFSTITVPGSAANLLEYRFGQWSLDAATAAVHVPHYLAGSSYPQAAVRAIDAIESMSGLKLGPEALAEACDRATEEIERQVEESEEVAALVSALESQYDEFLASREGVIPVNGILPTADEIGAEFERFLADRGRDLPGSS